MARTQLQLEVHGPGGGSLRNVSVEPLDDGRTLVVIDGDERVLDVRAVGESLSWMQGASVVNADIERGKDGKLTVTVRGHTVAVEVVDQAARRFAEAARRLPAVPAGPVTVRAAMPGRIVKVLVRVGDVVKAGAGLVVVEAMKMENEIRATRDGTVREIAAAEGSAVEASQPLIVLD